MKRIAIIGLSLVSLLTFNSYARDVYKETLSRVPAAELPIKAAELIKDAKPRNREGVTVDVVKAAIAINPAAAPVIASTIARAIPEMAATAAAAAATAQPKQASLIARAVASAVPSKAGKVVVAVCRAVPNDYRNIAVAVSHAVPGSDKEILSAVANAFPELKASIDRALVGNPPSVSYALASITPTIDQSSAPNPVVSIPQPFARGPAIGPPFVPLTQTPTNITPATSGNVPPGARGGPTDYAQP